MNITSVGNNVVVRPMKDFSEAKVDALGLHTPESNSPYRIGEIISLPGDEELAVCDYEAAPGDIILFKPHGNELFEVENEKFLVVPSDNVIGMVGEDYDDEE